MQRSLFAPSGLKTSPCLSKFHETLSEESVYLRYFHMARLSTRRAHERLLRKCFIDYDREMALVAELTDTNRQNASILAVARLSRLPSSRRSRTCCRGDGQVPTPRAWAAN